MKNYKRNPSVVVIGAGMTGILLTIKLREAGVTDITIFEKSDSVGGTWRENSYPGVACDIPAHMYTYSFEPNPGWSNFFARGPEIKEYFERVARKFGVSNCVKFNEAVTDAHYEQGKWTVKTSKNTTVIADFLISASGILHHPAYPDIPGLDSFKGKVFHTAQWDHEVEIASGKRVGVIGTGSTAAQAIPELINTGAEVSVFQRTAQWIIPLGDIVVSEKMKARLYRHPWMVRLFRAYGRFLAEQLLTKAVIGRKIQRGIMNAVVSLNLKLSVRNAALRKKLTPNYSPGCKRIIFNKTFYRGIQQDNAHLVTEGIDKITEQGVLTLDGTLHKLDVLVLATGFKALNFMRPMNMTGRNTLHIEDAWKNKIRTYRSVSLPDYPNFFLMLGPNTPIGNYSVIAMSEVQTDYIIKLINEWRMENYDAIEVKESAVDEFSRYIKQGMSPTVWASGCQSWYLDADGDPILWPYTWGKWVKEMGEPDLEKFHLTRFEQQDLEEPEQKIA